MAEQNNVADYPRNLLIEIDDSFLTCDLPSDINGVIEYLLQTFLTPSEAAIIRCRFYYKKDYESLCNEHQKSKVYMELIEKEALNKLKSVEYINYLKYGIAGIVRIVIEQMRKEEEQLIEEQRMADIRAKDIFELKLGTRSYAGLLRYGARTIGDVEKLTIKQIMNIPRVGKQSVKEIVNAMQKFGITLK